MGRLTHIVAGSIASYKSADGLPIQSLKAYFTPVQEGTGDPSPINIRPITGWTGCAIKHTGKNMFDMNQFALSYSTYSIDVTNGVATATASAFYNIFVNGTKYIRTPFDKIGNKQVVIKITAYTDGNVGSNEENGLALILGYSDSGVVVVGRWQNSDTSPKTVTFVSEEGRAVTRMGITYSNKGRNIWHITECQIEIADTESSIESYNGIQYPVTFPAVGKNLIDITLYNLTNGWYVSGSNGSGANASGYAGTQYYIPVSHLQGQTVTLNKRPGGNNPGIAFYSNDSTGAFISGEKNNGSAANTPWTFTIPQNAKYMRVSVPANDTQIQIELGSSSTSYEPFNNTIYGGYIDPVVGKVVAEWALFSKAWKDLEDGTNVGEDYIKKTNSTSSRIVVDQSRKTSSICNIAKYVNSNSDESSHFYVSGTNYFHVILPKSLDGETIIKIAVPLSTPIEYDILPSSIDSLIGQNNIWSNLNGNTEVEYEFVDSLLAKRMLFIDQGMIIPPAYQKYDYLEILGSYRRIDTGVSGDDETLQIDTAFKWTAINANYIGIFGNYLTEADNYCWRAILPNVSNYQNLMYVTTGNTNPGTSSTIYPVSNRDPILNKKIVMHMEYGKCVTECEGNVYTATKAKITKNANTTNIALGSSTVTAGQSGYTTKANIYYFRMFSNGRLIRNYIPVVRKSDSKAGFYDTVNHTFNPSITSSDFVAGNET